MSGHVRQRGNKGQWYAVIDVLVDRKRKRRWHKLEHCKGKREAEKACERLIAQQAEGTYVDPSRMTVAAFLERWIDHMQGQVSPRSHERYAELCRKNIVPLLGGLTLTKLQPVYISQAYAKALASGRRDGKGGLSPASVHYQHRVLKKALGQAVKWRLLPGNPVDAVDPPRVERTTMRTYDMAQTAEALALARPTRLYVPVLLALLCGLRRGEITALRWRNVDLDAGQLAIVESTEQTSKATRLKETKTGRARTVALPSLVVEELRRHRIEQAQELLRIGIRQDGESFVYTREDRQPMQPRSLTHAWDQFRARTTTLPRIRFHDLRHSHATHLLASNVHPKIASERLGHAKVGITLDLYSHVLPGMQADAAARVDLAAREAINRHLQKEMVAKR
jgi:integrase